MTAVSPVLGGSGFDDRARWTFRISAVILVAFLTSLILRRTGSHYTPVDGWGVSVFELAMGALCMRRFFAPSWRSNQSAARFFPLVLGAAITSWALGDVALTVESLGGATPSVPSIADGFYVGFYPLCFISFIMVIRRGTSGSLVATSLDGVIAGFAVAAMSAAFLFSAVLHATGGSDLSTATNMAYPVGDFLLLALALGGITILSKEYRRFLVLLDFRVS